MSLKPLLEQRCILNFPFHGAVVRIHGRLDRILVSASASLIHFEPMSSLLVRPVGGSLRESVGHGDNAS